MIHFLLSTFIEICTHIHKKQIIAYRFDISHFYKVFMLQNSVQGTNKLRKETLINLRDYYGINSFPSSTRGGIFLKAYVYRT